ncbi:MAG: hypothetical protein F6K40_11170 [Okeania sp. SIO3I5]|uniref:hypothetical protein n=1 Tax=Okeania sp. SIO3I5 TaxID=2607805 RepID=UPI0013B892C3|nr:hypothetical protein [Okeania sp. SIO3I5]NEQ36807.1 hypothetical protein [Okeania sp. SIO3I5]
MASQKPNYNNTQIKGLGSKGTSNQQEQLYQILIVEETGQANHNSTSPNLGLTTRVFTGTEKQLTINISKNYNLDAYEISQSNIIKDIKDLPNEGLDMNHIMPFLHKDSHGDKSLFITQYSTVRRLFQARKLSQLIASTWLDKTDNIEGSTIITKGYEDYVEKLLLRSNRGPDEPKAHNFNRWDRKEQMVIMPDQGSWQNINLNLLFCGQAYLWKKIEKKFIKLCEPILSTYEASHLFGFEVIWEDFAGIIEEISHSGVASPRGPYYKVSIPYPPRPYLVNEGEPGLCKPMIKKWVTAPDLGTTDENLPFAESKWSQEHGINIRFVTPPYPYLPMTCTS